MHFHIITLFPEAFASYFDSSILKRAQKNKKFSISLYNPRDFSREGKHRRGILQKGSARRIDDKPYGGGPGMVLEALPVLEAAHSAIGRKKKIKKLFLSPRGKQFDTSYAKRLAKDYSHVLLIAGHYEGVDARVKRALRAEEISIGPYTLTGGELPSMVIIDSVARQIPGVLGKNQSLEEVRTAGREVYTRPSEIIWKKKKYKVPKILLSGHHRKIEEWKKSI